METRAYSELYIENAQNVLGHMFDFAICEAGVEADEFAGRFAVSSVSGEIAKGNVTYVAGKTGPELANLVMEQTGYGKTLPEDIMFTDRSPQYWGGWILAYYQWFRDYRFDNILEAVKFSEIIGLYDIYHEMDVSKAVEELDRRMNAHFPDSALKRHRQLQGLSQRELAEMSGVALRQIQLFEQGQRDIRKAGADTVLKLSKALSCDMESLVKG